MKSDSCGFMKKVEMQGEGDRVLENLYGNSILFLYKTFSMEQENMDYL